MSSYSWDDLKPNQVKALTALLEGHTIGDSAALADVSRSTLNNWLAEDENFRAAYRATKAEALDTVSRKLVRLGTKATDTLENILDTSQNENVRVRAAVDSLTQLFKSIEVFELTNRLEELEKRLIERNTKP